MPDQLELILTPDMKALESGRVVLNSKLVNRTDSDVNILPWNTPFDTAVNGDFLRITRSIDGVEKELNYRGKMVKRAAPMADDYLVLRAGEVLSGHLEITNSYTFCDHTDYILQFKGVFYSPSNEAIEFGSAPLRFKYRSVNAAC